MTERTPQSKDQLSNINSAYKELEQLYQAWQPSLMDTKDPYGGLKFEKFEDGSWIDIRRGVAPPLLVTMHTPDKNEIAYGMDTSGLRIVEIRQDVNLPINLRIGNSTFTLDDQNRPGQRFIRITLIDQIDYNKDIASALVSWTKESIEQKKVTKPAYQMTIPAEQVK